MLTLKRTRATLAAPPSSHCGTLVPRDYLNLLSFHWILSSTFAVVLAARERAIYGCFFEGSTVVKMNPHVVSW